MLGGGIKSRKMKWAVHVARMRARRDAWGIMVGKPERKGPLGRLRLDGNMKVIWIFKK